MSIKKKYLKSKSICKVSFEIPKDAANSAKSIYVVGEFNEWDEKANPMKKLKNGKFTSTIELQTGKAYQFRYLVDNKEWENDWQADRYEYNAFASCENSVVIV